MASDFFCSPFFFFQSAKDSSLFESPVVFCSLFLFFHSANDSSFPAAPLASVFCFFWRAESSADFCVLLTSFLELSAPAAVPAFALASMEGSTFFFLNPPPNRAPFFAAGAGALP